MCITGDILGAGLPCLVAVVYNKQSVAFKKKIILRNLQTTESVDLKSSVTILAITVLVLSHSIENRCMHNPLLSLLAVTVNCVVCLQMVLPGIKVFLCRCFLTFWKRSLKSTLAL